MIVIRQDEDGFEQSINVVETDKFVLANTNKYTDNTEWMVYLERGDERILLIENPVTRTIAKQIFDKLVRAQATEFSDEIVTVNRREDR